MGHKSPADFIKQLLGRPVEVNSMIMTPFSRGPYAI